MQRTWHCDDFSKHLEKPLDYKASHLPLICTNLYEIPVWSISRLLNINKQ